VFGEEYLLMEMWRDGSRHVKKLVIIEELRSENSNRCLIVRKTGKSDEFCHDFSELGLIPVKRAGKWRVFENTPENFKALIRLASDDSPEKYLELIDCEEEAETQAILLTIFHF
jgi:hypothetical protein